MMKKRIRIGCGAGFSGDRLEPARILAEKGALDYLVLECLAERTIALAQMRKLSNPFLGYDPFLERRMSDLLPSVIKNGIKLVTNMGAANPEAAAEKVVEIAGKLNLKVKVAAVSGDDVLEFIDPGQIAMETGRPLRELGKLISANAYLGIEAIIPALESEADVIITGRVADPSLFLAPMVHAFGWPAGDFDKLGKGTVIGHLLECAGHITGGYFMDPGKKEVPDPDRLGHPFADVFSDGSAVISKVEGTGGIVSVRTAKEQLLYEVTDPFAYYTPDVIADFSTVTFTESGPDKVRVNGGAGRERPAALKVSAGYQAFYIGEGEISYAGANALNRARLAAGILEKRLQDDFEELRIDLIGCNALHRFPIETMAEPYEVRLRVAGKAESAALAALVGEEVEALYTNGPAGGGGARKYVREVIGIASVLIPRKEVVPRLSLKSS